MKPIVKGNFVYFGAYPQEKVEDSALLEELIKLPRDRFGDIEYGGERFRAYYPNFYRFQPIAWRILKRNGKELTLVSDKVLDIGEYANTERTTYESSKVRNFLVGDFLHLAFDEEEREMLAECDGDKVTLLDRDQAKELFATDEERVTAGTEYAAYKRRSTRGFAWWLRSTDEGASGWTRWVCSDGELARGSYYTTTRGGFLGDDYEQTSYDEYGIRPACKLIVE